MRLDPGRVVVRRQFQRDDLLSRLWVGHVAADDERGLWVWVANGSAYLDIGAADGRTFREVSFGEWGRVDKALREYRWRGEMLVFHPPGEAYSLWFFFDPDGAPDGHPIEEAARRFRSWYVNLEEPGVRWQDGMTAGIDTIDYDLDIVVAPDRTWRWKDEDEFAEHLAHPDTYWVDDAAAVWAEGERIVKLIQAGEFPFDGSHIDFRPDPTWTVPAVFPPGWDRSRARR
jgi:predicted RNA-binding protein associated with RNAse of E/G family